MYSRFSQVIVIGYGKTAATVLDFTAALKKEYGYRLFYIEHEVKPIPNMQVLCERLQVDYERITDRGKLTDRLLNISNPTLIVSAGNYYLFPKKVVEQKQVEIINFHNALLPKLPGRNATTWAIYLGEKVSGATWHYVTPNIDDGAIIAQKAVPVTEDMKAWELSRNIVLAAVELYKSFFGKLLEEHIDGTVQPTGKRKVYYSYEMPEKGICSINLPGEDVYRLLRSVDYGINDVFPPVKIQLMNGKEALVRKYAKVLRQKCPDMQTIIDEENNSLYFPLSDTWELKVFYKF